MTKTTKTLLAVIAMVLVGNSFVAYGQEADPLSEGNKYFETRNYRAAADVYRRIVRTSLDDPTRARAWFNLGMTYQKLGQYDDAINAFTQIFSMNVNDRETGGHIMEPYRNYRSRAQWEVGRSLFAKGDYKGALEAYQTTRLKYPLESWCNVERTVAQYRYALNEGLSYEHLGMYKEAVDSYLRVYVPRVADLYEAAGQLDDLKRYLDKKDKEYFDSVTEFARQKLSPEKLKMFRPTHRLRGMLEIYALGQSRDWPALIEFLRKWSSGGGDGRQDDIARILARYPAETVPLLRQELAKADVRPELMYKALGLAGTPDAVATLKSIAAKEENIWLVLSLVHALTLAGEPGERAIFDLEKTAKNNLKIAIDQFKSGELQERYNNETKFPPIPLNLRLPKEL